MDPLTAARLRGQQSLGAVSWPSDTGERYAEVFKGTDFARGHGCVPAQSLISYRTIDQSLLSLEPLLASQHSRVLLLMC